VQQPIPVPDMEPMKQLFAATGIPPKCETGNSLLDALAEVLNDEDAKQFQDEFFDQVDQHCDR